MLKIFFILQIILISTSCSFIKPSEIKINNKTSYDVIIIINNNSNTHKFKIEKNKYLKYQTFPTDLTITFSDIYNIKKDIKTFKVQYLSFYEIDYTETD